MRIVGKALDVATAGYPGVVAKGFNRLDRFYLAVPARGLEPTEVRIYVVQD